jgi:hypothetical protein
MDSLIREIEQADTGQMEEILKAAMNRFHQLFADKELSIIILSKGPDRNEQIDLNIALLKTMKKV